MKKLTLSMTLLVPGIAFAHPGHAVTEQLHAMLHGEHLLVLVAIVAAVTVTAGIIKKFK